MNNTEDMQINSIREKILNSDEEIKKILINGNNLEEIKKKIKNMSYAEIKNVIDRKIEQVKDENLEGEELQKVECELALLLSSLPINMKENLSYWKEKEKNARK